MIGGENILVIMVRESRGGLSLKGTIQLKGVGWGGAYTMV